jgi:hypothetical protein
MNIKKAWAAVKEDLVQDAPSELGPRAPVIAVAVVLAFYLAYVLKHLWQWYLGNVPAATPIGTALFAGVAAWVTFGQLKVARERHQEQTKADAQRRITETFSRAAEQLRSEKLAVRLGGIYTLERVSLESWRDYWPVMETLSAFVRERSRQTLLDESQVATDVAAVMAVICRRSKAGKTYERENGFRFDLTNADLRGVKLNGLELAGGQLTGANLQGARFYGGKFERVIFERADLSTVVIPMAVFDHCYFPGANLRGVEFFKTQMTNCSLNGADLSDVVGICDVNGTTLHETILNGALLAFWSNVGPLATAVGDGWTYLPNDVKRPAHWPRKSREPKPGRNVPTEQPPTTAQNPDIPPSVNGTLE